MVKYEKVLSKNEIDSLNKVVGERLNSLYSPSLNSESITSPLYHFYQTVLLSFETFYIAVDIEYLETEGWEEYWDIEIKEQLTPEPIKYNIDPNDQITIYHPLVSIGIWKKVRGYAIFTEEHKSEKEYIHSDAAIIFNLENDWKICLSGKTNWSALELTWDEGRIEEIIDGCYERYSYSS
ncbi:hypothetical protein GMD78_10910 [Ornithinibacillus sp. L9]|uniref:Uncharacterized protein n=1 Tax=Ornithinibacillus caprae TaxID=2678566 RepID=A0A6N8FHI6_9BACI|nr:hypothetical protein [Ornithinibacillus caprae]MUK88903.1 hypothetical protein [Ornithinibacillus caprae]